MQTYMVLDIHNKFAFAVVMNNKGKVQIERKVKNDPVEFGKFFSKFDKDSEIALESALAGSMYMAF